MVSKRCGFAAVSYPVTVSTHTNDRTCCKYYITLLQLSLCAVNQLALLWMTISTDDIQNMTKPTSKTPEDDAIAIIGLLCRLPGEASSPEGFWNLMVNGRCKHLWL